MSMFEATTLPLPMSVAEQLQQLNSSQLAWLSGYCWGVSQAQQGSVGHALDSEIPMAKPSEIVSTVAESHLTAKKITIISASQTGNARKVAEQLKAVLSGTQTVNLINAGDYKAKNIAQEQIVLLVTSTQGDGEPPEEALNLQRFLFGKKAPSLKGVEFAVLGLGDSSYPHFCQAGKDFDQRFEALGATRIVGRGECDIDFEQPAQTWIEQVNAYLEQHNRQEAGGLSVSEKVAIEPVLASPNAYTKENPATVTLSTRQKITGRYSSKDVEHIELDLADTGLQYQVGDALGVLFLNDEQLVDVLLNAVGLTGQEMMEYQQQSFRLRDLLIERLELTQNTSKFVQQYAHISQHTALQTLIEDSQALQAYVQATPLVEVVKQYPATLTPEQLVALLRPLTPRLYSIASAQSEVGEEVHLTVGVVRYDYQGHHYTGGASGFLGERLVEDGELKVFVEGNPHFRLPQDNSADIIMIGAGTGIAPFRAFMQQRAVDQAEGKNWLFFGNPTFTEDFLYQQEWQDWAKQGLLHRYHFAWSRDQQQKVYVQDKIREQAESLWQWLQAGAYVYVCGDASKMAKDVEQALLEVIALQGNLDEEQAQDYLVQLREDKRYQRDVY